MDLDYKKIGARIKAARLKSGYTQESLAEAVGLSVPHLSRVETGSKGTTLLTVIKIANALNISLDALVRENISDKAKVFHAEADCILSDCTDEEIFKLLELLQFGKKLIRK